MRALAFVAGHARRTRAELNWRRATHLELLKLHALVPAALERLLHAFDRYELLALVFRSTARARWECAGRKVQGGMPVCEPDGPKLCNKTTSISLCGIENPAPPKDTNGAIADLLQDGVLPGVEWRWERAGVRWHVS